MPQKHNDIKHGVDPEQIRRYLAGELDDKAMHILERQALEDPFLAEALDGFTGYADQTVHLDDLDRRLEKRVAGAKERKMYYRWAAAAAVLIVAGIGVMKLWQSPVKPEIASVKVARDTVAPGAVTDESGRSTEHPTAIPDLKLKKPVQPEVEQSKERIVEAAPVPAEAKKSAEDAKSTEVKKSAEIEKSAEYAKFEEAGKSAESVKSAKSAEVLSEPALASAAVPAGTYDTVIVAGLGQISSPPLMVMRKAAKVAVPMASMPAPAADKLLARSMPEKEISVPVSADMVAVKELNRNAVNANAINANAVNANTQSFSSLYGPSNANPLGNLQGRVPGLMVNQNSNKALFPGNKVRLLTGKVTAENTDSAIAGASVAVAGTNRGALTDKNGFFAIPIDSVAKIQLNVAVVGWASRRVTVGHQENNLKIVLPEKNRLVEDRAKMLGDFSKKSKGTLYTAPQPGEGMEQYKEYLVKNTRYPASAGSVKGVVRVAFTVKADGTLEDFKVLRPLQPDCDAEAIRLVKEGPAWIPASDGRATRAQVDVPFAP